MIKYKFRAWDGKKMNTDNFLLSPDNAEVLAMNTFPFTVENWSLMQFTGLKDKNGKEIFENDILLGKFKLDDVEDYIYLRLTEKEKETQYKIFLVDDIFYLYTNPYPEDIEVIGNVYEHPELLK